MLFDFGMWNVDHGEILYLKDFESSQHLFYKKNPKVALLITFHLEFLDFWLRTSVATAPHDDAEACMRQPLCFEVSLDSVGQRLQKWQPHFMPSSPCDSSEVVSSAEGREKHGALVEVIARAALDAQVFLPSPFRVFLPSSWRHQGRRRQHAPPLLHLVSCKNIEACQNHTEERVCGTWANFWMIIVIKIAKHSNIQLICN